jgi:hypothetical protein
MQGAVRTVTDEVLKTRLAIAETVILIKQVDELLASPVIRSRVWPPD